jgi:hypothetical protein
LIFLSPSLSTLAFVWQPIISPMQIFAAAAVLGALAVFAYARTYRGQAAATSGLLVMRLALVASIAVLLMGPSTVSAAKVRPIRPKLRILLDTSASMLTRDCGGLSRFEYVQEHVLNDNRIRALARDFDLELTGFDETLRPLPLIALHQDAKGIATGRSTHLSESVTSLLSRVAPSEEGAVVVLISDGRDTEAEPVSHAATLARNRKIPVHAIGLGGNGLQADLSVMAVPKQDYLLPGEPGGILVKVFQSGMDDARTTLTIEHGKEREQFPVEFKHKQVVEIEVPVKQDEPGQYEYAVSVEPVRGETETRNNRQVVFCDVQKKRIRVLILEGQPFWDSKFLAQSLRKDEHIEVTQITQLTASKRETIVAPKAGGQPVLPGSAQEWAHYDVVILGQAIEKLLQPESVGLLDDFVSNHGGHLIFARGLAYDPNSPAGRLVARQLAQLEPVVWGIGQRESLSLSLTPSGRASQWFAVAKIGTNPDQALALLPGFEKTTVIEREKPATIVLAQASTNAAANAAAPGQPAIVRMTYGRGTVVGVLGDGLWRWSLLPPDKQNLVGFYDSFWSNLVRWLAMGGEFSPDQQVALHLSRASLRLGDPLVVDVVYKHAPPSGSHPKLELADAGHGAHEVAMEAIPSREPRFRATLKPEALGVHQVVLKSPGMQPARQEKKFNVYDADVERVMTAADPMSLRMLAEHSGGRFYEADQAADLADQLRQYRISQQVPPRLDYIWDQGVILAALLVWGGAEWLLRRMAGLL